MARSFNGAASDHLAWTGGPILYNQTAASIGFWFKKDTMSSLAGPCFVLDQQAAFNKRIQSFVGDGSGGSTLGKLSASWRTPTGNALISAGTGRWDDGAWHRALIVRRSSSPFIEFYVDGVSDGSSTTDPSTDATAIAGNRWGDNFQGGDIQSFGSNGNGSLARCFIVSGTTLTPQQGDQMLYTGLSSIALSQWLELGVGSPEPDWSGNGLAGTVTGAAVAANGPWRMGWQNPRPPFSVASQVATQSLRRNAMLDGLSASGSFFGNPLGA